MGNCDKEMRPVLRAVAPLKNARAPASGASGFGFKTLRYLQGVAKTAVPPIIDWRHYGRDHRHIPSVIPLSPFAYTGSRL